MLLPKKGISMAETRVDKTPMAFMFGLVIGGVLAALFTPTSGDEMRKKIKNQMNSAKDSAKEIAEKAGGVADDTLDKAKTTVRKTNRTLKSM